MNFVCIVFELGDKMLTLSSMENLIVPCNPMAPRWPPGPQDGRQDSKMAAPTSRDDLVTRSGVCHALDHGKVAS